MADVEATALGIEGYVIKREWKLHSCGNEAHHEIDEADDPGTA